MKGCGDFFFSRIECSEVIGLNTLVSSRQHHLQNAITRDFGSIQEFRHAFFRTAQRGGKDGCVWLLVAPNGTLQITLTKARHVPRGSALFCMDLWEGGRVSFTPESSAEKIRRHWRAINWNDALAHYDALLQRVPPYPAP